VGDNPPNGAIVYYYLASAPKGVVTLEFLNAQSHLVRRYSNEEKKDADTPPEWPDLTPPEEKIPTEVGLNRFTWDLRTQGATPLAGEPGAEYRNRGAMVPPGAYQVRLTAEGKSYTVPLELKVDPRVKTSPEDLQKQNDLARQILAEISEIPTSVHSDVHTQIHGLDRRLGELRVTAAGLSAKEFDKKVVDVEGQLLQVNAK
jgi:hypothetical protein